MRKRRGNHGVEVRERVRELRRAVPYRPYALTMKDGRVLRVPYWLNIGFDPGDLPKRRGSLRFLVMNDSGTHDGSFDDVVSITLIENDRVDQGRKLAGSG